MRNKRNSVYIAITGCIVLGLFAGCATTGEPETDVDSAEAEVAESGDLSDLESLGEIEVDQGLFLVEVVLPADLAEGVTQESLDSSLAESGFRSAVLNADGTVTYTMTRAKHQEILADLRDSIQESANELIADEPQIYKGVEFDKDLRVFTVSVDGANFVEPSGWLEFGLAFQVGFYQIFAGTSGKNNSFTVHYVDDASGEALASSTLPRDE